MFHSAESCKPDDVHGCRSACRRPKAFDRSLKKVDQRPMTNVQQMRRSDILQSEAGAKKHVGGEVSVQDKNANIGGKLQA